MSIRIHAAGSDNFRYANSALPFGEVYNLASILSIVSAGPPHRVAGAAVDSQISPGSPVIQAAAAGGLLNARRVYDIGVKSILADANPPILFVAARQDNLLWPDSGSNLPETRLSLITERELTRELDEVLRSAELNTTGALFGIGTVFSFFSRHEKSAQQPRLHITISH